VLPARKLNDRALRFSHLVSSDKRNPARVFELRAGPAPQSHRLTANQRRGSYSLPPRLQSINLNGKTKPPDDAEPNAKLSVAVMVETEIPIVSPTLTRPLGTPPGGPFPTSRNAVADRVAKLAPWYGSDGRAVWRPAAGRGAGAALEQRRS
jgi:hypothetical protein